jgi:hypothetical protein
MENPLQQPPSNDPIQRVHEFARDLAYGVASGLWNVPIVVSYVGSGQLAWNVDIGSIPESIEQFYEYIEKKWNDVPPSQYLMQSFEYFDLLRDSGSGDRSYLLTEKAFALLEKPSRPPTVFISYKRDQSSALALLVEARLKLVGNPNPFIDKNIVAGEDWYGMLESSIGQCEFFVCLIGSKTLDSDYVRREIDLAAQTPTCRIISIWHGITLAGVENCPDVLKNRHAITISGESALEYEHALSQLLNAMGYATY